MRTSFLTVLSIAAIIACKSKDKLPTSGTMGAQPAGAAASTPAAKEPQLGSAADSVFFVLQRTPCFGSCPSYKLTIFRNGDALYEGQRFAPREGRFTGHVDHATMTALYAHAQQTGFFGLQDKYDGPVTDLPSIIIRVNADGKDKRVVGRQGTPQAFKDLAQFAEETLQPIEWTRTGDLK